MNQTRDMLSPDSLIDAEGDVNSEIWEAFCSEIDPAETQDLLCNAEALGGSQASECASHTAESCLREHPVALIASQMGERFDQAMDQTLASTLEPELPKTSSATAAITHTPYQESEPRTTKPPSSFHWAVSANDLGGAMNAQEDNVQPVVHDLGLGEDFLIIDEQPGANTEPIADHQDDQHDGHVAFTSLSERDAITGTTSPVPHTPSHSRHAYHERVTHENTDLVSWSSEDEEPSESIIVDTNGGEAIVINSTDEEMDNDASRQTPRRGIQRKRVSPRSLEMVDWTSREYERTSASSLAAAWKRVWKQWNKIHAESNRQLAQILDRFQEKMFDVQRYKLWNERYRKHDGRRAYRAWIKYRIEKRTKEQLQTKKVERLVCRFGRALQRLQEAEEEHRSISVTMKDGDSEDRDYVPIPTRRHKKKTLSV